MKNKRGFTLVELIAVIALLAVIITIAGISIVGIKENTLKNERANLRTTIKIAAKEYHEETGVDIVPVLVLLQTGRIEADEIAKSSAGTVQKGDPVIYDPVTGEAINCECVNFKDNADGKWDTATDCCSPEILSQTVEINYLYPNLTGTPVAYGAEAESTWFAMGNGEKFQLKGALEKSGGKDIAYTWINPSAPDIAVNNIAFDVEVPEIGYINGEYVVTADFDGRYAEKSFNLMIDGRLPFMENLYIEGIDTWSPSKTLHADFKDYESGLFGFYLKRTSGSCSKSVSDYHKDTIIDGVNVEINGAHEFNLKTDVKENGELSICLRDTAGNIIESDQKLTVSRIDNTNPQLKISVVNPTTYVKANTVNVELTDPGSEGNVSGLPNASYVVKYAWSTSSVTCNNISNSNTITLTDPDGDGKFTGSVEITNNTGAGKVYVCPKDSLTDLAGNPVADTSGNVISSTPLSYNMYLDNTKPVIKSLTITSNNTTYNDRTVKVVLNELSDANSGLKEVCLTTSNDSSSCTWKSNKNNTYTYTNVDTGLTAGSADTIKYYGFVKDAAGNISEAKDATYRIYGYCDETAFDHYGTYGECTLACGGGTKYRDKIYNDKYFTDHYCSTSSAADSTSCNEQDCCSSVYYVEGTECSAACDGGNRIKYAYSNYDGSRCNKKDTYSGAKCNEQKCCDEGTWSNSYCDCNGYYVQERYNGCTKQWESRESSKTCSSIWSYGSEGSCSTTCGTGSASVPKYCTTASGSTRTDYDTVTCSDDSGCVDTSVNCYLFASKRSSSTINCFWTSNTNCRYASTGGTYVDDYTRYWSVGTSGNDTCWGKTVNGTSASNYLRFNGSTAQYACNSKGWCNC